MCKCCQYCLESCYWHLIEKRFCYDESIALYEVPEKEEKNNNMFDNMAFFDSVAVIAGRSIVTIDPLPPKHHHQLPLPPIIKQPTRTLRWEEQFKNDKNKEYLSKSVPTIYQPTNDNVETSSESIDAPELLPIPPETVIDIEHKSTISHNKLDLLKPDSIDPEIRRKSLRERRLSKSLYLRIEQPKELPLIRQQSMPKFYLDTPDENYADSIVRPTTPSTVLTSAVVPKSGFVYDLYSVVQMEKERLHNLTVLQQHQHQQQQNNNSVNLTKDDSGASRLALIKEKIKLRRVRSALGTPAMHLPHSHNHI